VVELAIDVALLALLAATALGIVLIREPFSVAMLMGLYSLLAALLFVTLDAVDVAFTEAAVGAGISTILMLGTLALTTRERPPPRPRRVLPAFAVVFAGAGLVYGTLDMPPLGHPGAPAHNHVAPRYLEASPDEIGIPNAVTSVLASYRGYDTLGEVVVIFTAGVGVLALLGSGRRRGERQAGADSRRGPPPAPGRARSDPRITNHESRITD